MKRWPGRMLTLLVAAALGPAVIAWAEYADVTINTRSEAEGVLMVTSA